MTETLIIGKIIGVHGIDGWLVVYSYADTPTDIFDYPHWCIGNSDYQVQDTRQHGNKLLAKLSSISDRDAAMALRGLDIHIERQSLPTLEENTYYWQDIIGLQVRRIDDGVVIGTVRDMIRSSAHDVLVIDRHGEETLIPFVAALVPTVAINDGYLCIEAAACDAF